MYRSWLGYDPPEENLLELLLAAAIDPNPHRPSLMKDIQHVRELACSSTAIVVHNSEQ